MRGEIVEISDERLEGCAELYVAVFNAPPWSQPWTVEVARPRLADMLATPRAIGFVWLEGESRTPVGFAIGRASFWVDGLEFLLNELCVRADRQGQGIGSRLLQRVERHAAEAGARSTCLSTEAGTSAVAFYAKHGYATNSDTVAMSRGLG